MLAPCRASTLISTACSWVNIGGQKATILAQVGPLYLGAVGQFCIGANTIAQPTGLPMPVKARVADEALVRRRRQQIIEAAVELFSDQGYYRTTVQEIAARAGVSTGLIYQYVEDKDDILLLSILGVIESYSREIPVALEGIDDPLQRFRVALGTYCRVVDRLRKSTVLAYRPVPAATSRASWHCGPGGPRTAPAC